MSIKIAQWKATTYKCIQEQWNDTKRCISVQEVVTDTALQ